MKRLTHYLSSWKNTGVLVLVAVHIAINLFHIGSDAFIINLNNFLVIPLALAAALLGWLLWSRTKNVKQHHTLWMGLATGWTMWAIAEVWWAISSFSSQELPYPSWADLFWLAAYIPMVYALWGRFRSIPRVTNAAQKAALWVLLAVVLGFTIAFIFLPILLERDWSVPLETAFNFAYPLADTILLILVLRLLFNYQQGMYGQAWRWIAVGFVLCTFSDLLFVYATRTEIYYPEQQVNFLSSVGIDVPYILSYLLYVIGLLRFKEVLGTYQAVNLERKTLPLIPNAHLLVFTKANETVIDVSRNFSQVFLVHDAKGKTISQVLGLSPEDESSLLQETRAKGVLQEKPFLARTLAGQQEILISGIVVLGPQGEYSGATFLIRLLAKDYYSLDDALADQEKGLVRFLLGKTGAGKKEQAEKKQFLTEYYQAYLSAFYRRVYAEGGSIFADALMTRLRTAATAQGLQIGIQPNIVDVSDLSLLETERALSMLFAAGRQSLVDLIGEPGSNALVEEIRASFGNPVLQIVSCLEKEIRKHT
ncbi:MAG: hypothetical protein BWY63_00943 [Chloroflexi bacterium ADurb.Bin360]|nr:MAG: hypothetical protein BWY63_00943 [Chloroflexi bacterium ADurb.Bin360]